MEVDAAPVIGDYEMEAKTRKEGDGQSIRITSVEPITRPSEGSDDDDDYDGDHVAIEQVWLTVSREDDPSLPVWTFRMWSLGLASCVLLSFLNQFFSYRAQSLSITMITIQVVSLPIGRFMAATLPNYKLRLPSFLSKRKRKPTAVSGAIKDDGKEADGGQDDDDVWFSLNPGPFNIKEHVLICIFANAGADFGAGSAYAVGVVNIVKALYKRQFPFVAGLLLIISTQVLGYGLAGLFRSYLVDPSHMWWPGTLPQVTLFRTLHEKEKGSGLSRNRFFITFLVASFVYYTLPGYFMPILTTFSWVCWAFPNSISLQQVGSGYRGLGLGSFSFDWAGISAFLGSPLVSPLFVIGNIGVGFFLFVYIAMPVGYWSNLYDARKFPIYSYKLFTKDGSSYNTSFILNDHFEIDQAAYAQEGQVHLSLFFALAYGIGFATIASTITHVICFHGKEIWQHARAATNYTKLDIHTRLMQQNYLDIPQWWWHALLFVSILISFVLCEVFKSNIQLPWWGLLLACILAWSFTLPFGIITATTNQTPGLNIIIEYIMGYILPGRPIANVCFKVYGYMSMTQALAFLSDFKLGHYMKIPPRSMFMVQIIGTTIAAIINMVVAWWMLESIPNICDQNALPSNSPWTCPGDNVFFDASIIWGLVGPRRIFGNEGVYPSLNWFFLGGILLPVIVWSLKIAFPSARWISLINIPIFFRGMIGPPASTINAFSWIVVGIIFNYFVFKKQKAWWTRYNYVLSAALDAGVALLGVFLYFCLQMQGININWWGNDKAGEHCPLAQCPTIPNIHSDYCPY